MKEVPLGSGSAQRAFALVDLAHLAGLVLGGGLTAVVPAAWDPTLTKLLHRLAGRLFSRRTDLAQSMRVRLAPPERDWDLLAEEHVRMRTEDSWCRFRGLTRAGWTPQTEVIGAEALERALSRGRGAVIWMVHSGGNLAIFHALRNLGFPLTHVSSPRHGSLTGTTFALSTVAALYRIPELNILAERIEITSLRAPTYLNKVRERLRCNACVSLFGEHTGMSNVQVPFMGGIHSFATGAPSLAWTEDAGLFTAAATRTGALRYRVTLEQLPVDRTITRKQFAIVAVEEFVGRLEQQIRQYPADWQGWSAPHTHLPALQPSE